MSNTTVAGNQDSNLQFKAVFGFALLFIIVIGAGLSLAGREFPFWEGICAGIAGGLIGFVASRQLKQTRSN